MDRIHKLTKRVLQNHRVTILPTENIHNETTSSYSCSTPHFSISCASDNTGSLHPTVILSSKNLGKNLARAPGQSAHHLHLNHQCKHCHLPCCMTVSPAMYVTGNIASKMSLKRRTPKWDTCLDNCHACTHTSVPPTHQDFCSLRKVTLTVVKRLCSFVHYNTFSSSQVCALRHYLQEYKDLFLPPFVIIKMGKQYVLLNSFCQSSHSLIIFWNNLGYNQKEQPSHFVWGKISAFLWVNKLFNCYKTVAEFFLFLSSTKDLKANTVNAYSLFMHEANKILCCFMQLQKHHSMLSF